MCHFYVSDNEPLNLNLCLKFYKEHIFKFKNLLKVLNLCNMNLHDSQYRPWMSQVQMHNSFILLVSSIKYNLFLFYLIMKNYSYLYYLSSNTIEKQKKTLTKYLFPLIHLYFKNQTKLYFQLK